MSTVNPKQIEEFFKKVKEDFSGEELRPRILEMEGGLYNDSEMIEREDDKIQFDFEKLKVEDVKSFKKIKKELNMAAIDTSTIQLGITKEGIIMAVRSAIVVRKGPNYCLYRFGPRILSLTVKNKNKWYAYIRASLGFKKVDKTPELSILQDRIRNYIERLTQREAVKCIKGGIVLFDGTLIGETFDTPKEYVQKTLAIARKNKNSVLALSKKTRLITKGGASITNLLSDKIHPCYLHIDNIIEPTYRGRSLGNIFIGKFSMDGYSFRVDSYPYYDTHDNLLSLFYCNSSFKLGYPDVLRYAHIFSYFTAKEVLELQCLASVKYKLKLKKSYDVKPALFGPFSFSGGAY